MPETAIPTGIPIHRLPAATPATGRKPPIGYKTHQEPITFIFHPLDTKSLQIERPPNDTLHEHEFLPPGSGSVAQPPKYLKELMLFNLNPAPSCIHLREEPVKKLTLGDRAALATWIVENLDELSEAEIEALWAKQGEHRLDELEQGSVTEIPAEEVVRRARAAIS